MAVHLVRHADAGRRGSWDGPDGERPLVASGRAAALVLLEQLRSTQASRILSSPLVRCVQTVQPLADALSVVVETHPALAEGAPLEATWALLEALVADGEAVLCSHGDVIPPVLDRLARRGILVAAPERDVAKGSVWTVEASPDGRLTSARLAFAP